MAHEISINSVTGREEFAAALRPAWHGLGQVLDYVPDSGSMITAAGLDWTVEARPVYTPDKTGSYQPVTDRRAIVRCDTDEPLGIVSSDYGIVQNHEAFQFVDSLMQDGIMKYETAGALKGGRLVFLLARLPSSAYIGDSDEVRSYLLFQTSHDGSMKLSVGQTNVRVVCWNTLSLALAQGVRGVSLRHTSGIKLRLEEVRDQIASLDAQFTRFTTSAQKLRDTKWTADQAKAYIAELFPTPTADAGRAVTIWKNRIQDVRDRLRNERQAIAGMDNLWGLYNSVSESLDRASTFRGDGREKDENRFLSTIQGNINDSKKRAFELALTMAS